MPTTAYIYLSSPYLAISQTASIYNVKIPQGSLFTFGYVRTLNKSTVNYSVGDRVLYPQPDKNLSPVILIGTPQYDIVKETDIVLIEPIPPST